MMHLTVQSSVRLSDKNIEEVFKHRLEQLTEGWYLAPSNKEKNRGRVMLCIESEPHPHNGDTWREREVEINTPGFEVIVAAVTLQQALKEKK